MAVSVLFSSINSVYSNLSSKPVDPRVLPFIFAYLSFLWLLITGVPQLVKDYARQPALSPSPAQSPADDEDATSPSADISTNTNTNTDPNVSTDTHTSLWRRFKAHARAHGGYAIYGFMLARVFGAASLLAVSLYVSLRLRRGQERCLSLDYPVFWTPFCVEDALIYAFAYALLLSLTALLIPPTSPSLRNLQSRVTRHFTLLTLLAFGAYVYRDVWPLATYDPAPANSDWEREGAWVVWTKIALLAFVGVGVPLCVPHEYVPVDPEHPMPEPGRELTDPWISKTTYSYLDTVILAANRRGVTHLGFDQLPPLLDVDGAAWLVRDAFRYLDPFQGAKRRHLFWGLLYYFRYEYMVIAICLFLSSVFSFAAPVGINQVLAYLETRDQPSSPPDPNSTALKPWLWILVLFWGAVLKGVVEHWELYLLTVVLVRIQALLTQLVFEHSLRIRVKAEAGAEAGGEGEGKAGGVSTGGGGASTPVEEEAEEEGHAEREDNETQSTSASTIVALSSSPSSSSEDTPPSPSSRGPSEATLTPQSRSASASASGSVNGKGKGKTDSDVPSTKKGHKEDKSKEEREREDKEKKEKEKKTKDAENLMGRINNLVTSDLDTIIDGMDFLSFVIYVPLQITLSMVFLVKVLGWSALVGLFCTLALSPIAGFIAKYMGSLQVIKMKKTDARVQSISEAIGVIRMIKLFGWEHKMTNRIEEKREEELRWLWKVKALGVLNGSISSLIPTLSMFMTYMAYTVIMKEELSPSKIFSSIAVFSILRDQLGRLVWQANLMIQTKVSLDRISNFLKDTELLDQYTEKLDGTASAALLLPPHGGGDDGESRDDEIGFRNATFAWTVEEGDGSLTPSSRNFRLHVDGELLFKRNCINMIIGPTGSGKTSILMALLGEMHFLPSQADSWFNLPRAGGVAYAAQESWVQSATIKENILFGAPYDEERYKKVIRQCALEKDLELFDAGDNTEVGERGLTLSGGQKARVTLARAIYSSANIILLDDVLAALDVHTSAWIVDKCFRGDLVKGRTVLLVTHNIALVGPIAGFVVSLGLDGSINSQGTDFSALLENDARLASEVEEEKKALEETKEDAPPEAKPSSDGKLVVAEEIQEGHITWKSINLLLSGLGGRHPGLFLLTIVLGLSLSQVLITGQTWFLGVWGTQYEHHAPSEVRLSYYLTIFSLIILVHFIINITLHFFFNYRMVVASRTIHDKLVHSIFGSTFRWLDETPTARIIARCTQDIRVVDTSVASMGFWVIDMSLSALIKLGAIILFTPIFVVPGLIVAVVGTVLGNWYIKAQLSIKREMSNARSPLLAHFNASIHGIVSIRAYGAQQAFRLESYKRIDHYSRIARTSWNVNRWIGLRMDFIGAVFTASLAFYQVYIQSVSAANTGFSLNMSVSFCMFIFFLIRIYNMFEVESNSLERIQGYLDIDHEPKPVDSGQPPAAWPTSGDLRVENLSARYSQTGPRVLHSISFHINSGERIGVVGRTGSGKSSLTLALLRCIITEGKVYYDGIATDTINLDALRSNITIIPQTPELLSGTLRQNLDPFEQNDDATLNDALRAAGLFSLQEEAGEARLTLDSKIAGGGSNLSVGQRQIIALARAMVRGSKLLILDEATSAIDYKTDAVIQRTLRSQLGSDVTVITVAHRLQTIMDADKIMVLDNGNIVEFDSPEVLLKKEKGALKALVDGSGDRDVLYDLARRSKS